MQFVYKPYINQIVGIRDKYKRIVFPFFFFGLFVIVKCVSGIFDISLSSSLVIITVGSSNMSIRMVVLNKNIFFVVLLSLDMLIFLTIFFLPRIQYPVFSNSILHWLTHYVNDVSQFQTR